MTLAKECYVIKLDLLTNATVVDDAIRFVSSHPIIAATEKDSVNCNTRLDKYEERLRRNDVQRSEESHIKQSRGSQQQITLSSSKILLWYGIF